jgi:hypothetical protein
LPEHITQRAQPDQFLISGQETGLMVLLNVLCL